jgi:ATP-dependent DNA helicase RecQ
MHPRPTPADLDAWLRLQFGLPGFRGLQRPVIDRVLAGQDALALMPTGAGKSLCFQVPSLLHGGLTLVVSPLIALMRDQARRLAELGIPARAMAGPLTPLQRRQMQQELARGCLRVLLVSPERALGEGFLANLAEIVAPPGVRLLVVDEAHCIADWGREFRPVYTQLGQLRRHFPGVPMLAMTASADRAVERRILDVLGMSAEAILRDSFDRPELFYRVGTSPAPWRHALAYLQWHHPADCAIFYCRRRWETEAMARFLSAHGVPTVAYHAGLSADLRQRAEHWFLGTPGAVIAATIAFGMGIDRPDIRLVIHLGAARNLAAYYQESGRAGRDGSAADALLLLPVLPGQHQSLAWPEGEEDVARLAMDRYLLTTGCRRIPLMAAFGQTHSGGCGACDRCAPTWHPLPALRACHVAWAPVGHPARE